MPPTGVISLDLHKPQSADAEWLQQLADQMLGMLGDLLAAGGEPERVDLSGRLNACRTMIDAAAAGEADARQQVTQCLARCREVANHAGQQETDRRQEMASLVALVREAVVTVESEIGGWQTSMNQSADRFQTISGLDDPRQIKERLKAEVITLKQVAAERRHLWEATSKRFSERVETLEQQLVTTRNEAALDALTGIANRRTFDRTCQEWIRSARSRFVLAMFDVDDFKMINDTQGHAAGDQVLISLAQALVRSVRPDDVVARLGGDEFAILASELTLRQAESRFGRTIATLASPEGALPAKVSCGLAEFSAGDTYESLCERADQALYAAKRGGKHRVASKARAFIRDLMKR